MSTPLTLSTLCTFTLTLEDACLLYDSLHTQNVFDDHTLYVKINGAFHTLESCQTSTATVELTTTERGIITTLLSRLLNDDDYFPGLRRFRNCQALRERLRP